MTLIVVVVSLFYSYKAIFTPHAIGGALITQRSMLHAFQ